ncbi:phage tail tape measure protein [Aeromonas veronii]|uniref:phage tail tape measure protein n=1 Tax=Aeromonas veronii TaxID=654 RepID=UPI000CD41EBF|nr:phage tail tape measure protein [Aeromonas veronii]MCX0426054.1 phage tail tape measure protein [Aeromonas veronii]MCX0449360.1 phage tail tape measure protein [Aeromonas veronii]POG18231.1 phage tail tape measure protein [Aeromonas veronii]
MASVTEQLIMRIALIDAVTRPLEGINSQLNRVKETAQSGFANIAGGGAAMLAGTMAIQNALRPALEMDAALAEVASLDVHEKTLKQLSDTALMFSVKYGESASAFVSASYDIQSAIAGLEGNELPSFARASGVLAKATKADTATITNYMGTMYGIFEQQAKKMGKANWVEDVAGKTAQAVQMFKTTGQGMTDAFKGIGANATAAGISMDEQFAVLGHLQATMGGGEAGTKFKSFLAGVGSAQKALGLKFTDSAGNMLPVLDILDKLKARYGDTLTVAGSDELKKAFGSDEAVSMIKLLMSNTQGLATSINALANTHGMGKAEQMAGAMVDQWQRVKSAWFAIRAAAFGALLPAINKVVGAFADGGDLVLRWTRLFPNLTKVVGAVILAIAGLSIVTGARLMLAIIYWDELRATFAVLTDFELLGAFFGGLAETFGPLASQALAPVADFFTLIVGLLGQGIAWLGSFFEQTNQASVGIDNVADAGRRMGAILGAVFDTLLTPWRALIALIKTALDASNQFLGTQFDTGALNVDVLPKWAASPTDITPPATVVNSPLASYRQQDQSKVPSGGLGQQLIQANAAATTTNQKPAKAMHIGEVHNHFANPITPGEMEQEMWITTK